MNIKDRFKDYLVKNGYDTGTADDYASHLNRISECFEIRIGDLYDPNTIMIFGRLDDNTLDEADYKRWKNALRHYITFLKQL